MFGFGHRINKLPYWSPVTRQINKFIHRVNINGGEIDNLVNVREILKQHPNAKLIITPSGTFTGSLPSIIPNDGTGDFDYVQNTDNGTIINKDGKIESVTANKPRITWVDGVPLILVENQATNLVAHSEDLTQWTKASAGTGVDPVITPNAETSVLDEGMADLIAFDKGAASTAGNSSLISIPIAHVAGNDYAGSLWVKAATPSDIGKDFAMRPFGTSWVVITLTDKWVRWERTNPATVDNNVMQIGAIGATSTSDQVGVLIAGIQNEKAPSASSTIQTTGAIATRNADLYTKKPPVGTAAIIEYLSDGSVNTINTIPATYQPAPGLYKYIVMK